MKSMNNNGIAQLLSPMSFVISPGVDQIFPDFKNLPQP